MTDIGQRVYSKHAFTNDLPINPRIDTRKTSNLTMQIQETDQFLGMYDKNGNKLKTEVWGYAGPGIPAGFHGPTIIAYENKPLTITWNNELDVDGHLLPVDETIHQAEPTEGAINEGFIPIVTHLHGGHVDSIYDGNPDQWYTQNGGTSAPAEPQIPVIHFEWGFGIFKSRWEKLWDKALDNFSENPKGLFSLILKYFPDQYQPPEPTPAPTDGPGSTGIDYVGTSFTYDNSQESAPLWYHDHALGITRLNVYAGLAGMYLLQDGTREKLAKKHYLPDLDDVVDVVIQDYSFDEDGNLYYPGHAHDVLPGDPGSTVADEVGNDFFDHNGMDAASALPEYFGDVILANGMAWPTHDVARGDVQFTLLNGSDSRFYKLELDNAYVSATIVGSEGGLMPRAREVFDGDGIQEADEFIILAPAERLDIVFDFSKLKDNDKVTLLNTGPAYEPYKGVDYETGELNVATAATIDDPVGAIMQFDVDGSLRAEHLRLRDGKKLNRDFDKIKGSDIDHTRKLGLFEGADEWGRIKPLLGTAEEGALHSNEMTPDGAFGPLSYMAPITEKVQLNSYEYWDIFNFSEDAHPVHIHLIQFQNVAKYAIDYLDDDGDGIPDDINGDGKITYGSQRKGDVLGANNDVMIFDKEKLPFRAEDEGWQDTTTVGPKEMVRVAAYYDKPGEYVWHCHILSHEDNDMMRSFVVEDMLV